jgi:hypothetical protein
MILSEETAGMKRLVRSMALAAFTLSLAACAPMEEVDNTTGSRLVQPPAGVPPQPPIEAGDIAIVGQMVSHAIMALPAVADASIPPLVRFNGVTSIVVPPIDTEPYTVLLRDRLLLLTREKLRFVEHTLPPYTGKKRKSESQPVQNTQDAQYKILAELRGRADADTYRIQVQFVDIGSSEILFDAVYRIRKEADMESAPPPESSPENTGDSQPPPPTGDLTTPTTTAPSSNGGGTL